MPTRPDFTDGQRKRLTELGVVSQQVEQLRLALIEVRRALLPTAARNDVKDTLADVSKQAGKLVQLLGRIALRVDAKRSAACTAIEIGYWQRRPGDDGATSMHHLIPRLSALADAARDGIKTLPKGQTRHRTASWAPIQAIDFALRLGWSREHGPHVMTGGDEELAAWFKRAKNMPRTQPYPRKFRPSESPSSTFSKIVGVCYEAEGAPHDAEPRAAMRAYLKVSNACRKAMLAGMEKAMRESAQ